MVNLIISISIAHNEDTDDFYIVKYLPTVSYQRTELNTEKRPTDKVN